MPALELRRSSIPNKSGSKKGIRDGRNEDGYEID